LPEDFAFAIRRAVRLKKNSRRGRKSGQFAAALAQDGRVTFVNRKSVAGDLGGGQQMLLEREFPRGLQRQGVRGQGAGRAAGQGADLA
jgi:hypothetical protein